MLWIFPMNFLPRSVYLSINLFITVSIYRVFPSGLDGKESAAMREPQVWSLGLEDPLEEEMATHSSILAWRIPWTEETGWAIVYAEGVGVVTKSQTQLSN